MFNFGLTPEQEDRARKLHEESIIIDMLDNYFRSQKQGGLTVASHTVSCDDWSFARREISEEFEKSSGTCTRLVW